MFSSGYSKGTFELRLESIITRSISSSQALEVWDIYHKRDYKYYHLASIFIVFRWEKA